MGLGAAFPSDYDWPAIKFWRFLTLHRATKPNRLSGSIHMSIFRNPTARAGTGI